VRGRNGGVRLARAASTLTLFDIVTATEGSFSIADCFQDRSARCQLIDACGLNTVLRSALQAFFEVLSNYTIEDLVTARPKAGFFLDLDISPLAVRSGPAPCL
jgi:Rrf2 family iron-responsive transcriptional regulator